MLQKVNLKKLAFSIILPFAAAVIGSYFTTPAIDSWYATLNKPSFNPPNWLFGPVWTILYLLLGIAFYIFLTNKGERREKLRGKTFFYFQLILNAAWSLVFFGLKDPAMALMVILVLWFFILLTIVNFYKVNKNSAYFLIPYLLWVSFAALLNYFIWKLN